MNILTVRKLSMSFGKLRVLNNINFEIEDRSFVSIIGPNGCGKSTILNIIAGFFLPNSGEVILDGTNITGVISGKFGYMLQKDLLLPWRTLFDNLKLITELDSEIVNRNEIDDMVRKCLESVGLKGFENYYPYQLSGGMSKRAALARTLLFCKLRNSKVILMDEPFSSLDSTIRVQIESDLKDILRKEKKTAILVTHDIDEAISLSEKIIVMSHRPANIISTIDVKRRNASNLRRKIILMLRQETESNGTRQFI